MLHIWRRAGLPKLEMIYMQTRFYEASEFTNFNISTHHHHRHRHRHGIGVFRGHGAKRKNLQHFWLFVFLVDHWLLMLMFWFLGFFDMGVASSIDGDLHPRSNIRIVPFEPALSSLTFCHTLHLCFQMQIISTENHFTLIGVLMQSS
jgi:hypothetical protein